MGHRKEDRRARGFLEGLLSDKPAGENASAQMGQPEKSGGRGQWTPRGSNSHISYYEGTSEGDGSVSVDRVNLDNSGQESGRESI